MDMPFEEALKLVEKAFADATKLTGEECFKVNLACAVVAREYLLIKHRIMPA